MASTARRLNYHHQLPRTVEVDRRHPPSAGPSNNASIEVVYVEDDDQHRTAEQRHQHQAYQERLHVLQHVSHDERGGIGGMDENVAERILETLQSKDAYIEELQRSITFVTMDRDRLQRELEDAVTTRESLLIQYGDVLKDVRELETMRADLETARGESARYSSALDDANKALTLQLEALTQQVNKCDAAEAQERLMSREKLALEEKLQKLSHKNRVLLEELKKMASDADEGSERHAKELRELGNQLETLHNEVLALRTIAAEKRQVDLQLSDEKSIAAERQERIKSLEDDLTAANAELDATVQDLDEARAHMSLHRDALESVELSQHQTETVATNAATDLQQLRMEFAELQRRYGALEQRLAAAEDDRHEMQIEIDDAEQSVQDWKAQFAESRRELSKLESQLHASTATFEAKAIQWQQELDVCQQQLSTQHSILTTRRELEATMLEEHQEQTTAVADLEDTLDVTNFKFQKLFAKYQALLLERKDLEEKNRQENVVHAAECRELQELASTVAAGQSTQIQELTQSQERLVGRLLAAEDEVTRLTERSAQLERSLALREQDVHHVTQQHAAELRRGQALCVTANEKALQDVELKRIREVVIPNLEQRIEELTVKLDASQRRCSNLKERTTQDAAQVARAKSVESDSVETSQLVAALRDKISALETALSSKREALRSTLEDRSKLIAQMDEMRQEVATMHTKVRSMQRHSDDQHRASDLAVKDANHAKATAERDLQALRSKGVKDAAQRLSSDLCQVVRRVIQKMLERSQRTHHRKEATEALLHKVLDKYEHDVEVLQSHLAEAEASAQSLSDALHHARGHMEVLEQERTQYLQAQTQHHHTTGDAALVATKVLDVSKELRPSCHNISVDILGISLNDLIGLQMAPAPQVPTVVPTQEQRTVEYLHQAHHTSRSSYDVTGGKRSGGISPMRGLREEFLASRHTDNDDDHSRGAELLKAFTTAEHSPDADDEGAIDGHSPVISAFRVACDTPQVGDLMLTAFDRSPLRSLISKFVERMLLASSEEGADEDRHIGDMPSELRETVRQVLFGMSHVSAKASSPSNSSSQHQTSRHMGFADSQHDAVNSSSSSSASARLLYHAATLRSVLLTIVDLLI